MGWWGRAGPAFDDTEAQGQAVVLTAAGLEDLIGAFGPLTRHCILRRKGREEGLEVDAGTAKRSLVDLK
jgi:hypothetical protein